MNYKHYSQPTHEQQHMAASHTAGREVDNNYIRPSAASSINLRVPGAALAVKLWDENTTTVKTVMQGKCEKAAYLSTYQQ
jgi:hypothetical protein